jgi:DNA-binding protein YbaB
MIAKAPVGGLKSEVGQWHAGLLARAMAGRCQVAGRRLQQCDAFSVTVTRLEAHTGAPAGLADVVAVEESRDGLVKVTAGVLGDLRGLRLDPRIHYDPDADALAARILRTHQAAADRAWRSGTAVAGLPPDTRPGEVDLIFDPVLDDLGRRIADPRRDGSDGRPVLADCVDYRSLRGYFLQMREEASRVCETAVSGDRLVAATVSGQGELLGLALDHRIYRAYHTAGLAEQILTMARRAAVQAGDRLAAISKSITSSWEV